MSWKSLRAAGFALAAVLGAGLGGCAQSETAAPGVAQQVQTEQLTIETHSGPVRFNVEIADDDAERQRGLMFRRSLADDHGMLFDFPQPEFASFWMRNTVISLDIIFIGVDGRILNIADHTTPYSEAPIPAAGLTRGVLEIRAGRAAELGIRPGDRVRHRIFPS
ncbi:MAG: DUF192 domain-containing protein [Hyphomonadaceae bacterium]